MVAEEGMADDLAALASLESELVADDAATAAALLGGAADAAPAAASAGAPAPHTFPDGLAVHVSNLPEEVQPEELYEHFKYCGEVRRIIIKVDKNTGARLGFAYIDFAMETHVDDALLLHESDLKGSTLKVNKKRLWQNSMRQFTLNPNHHPRMALLFKVMTITRVSIIQHYSKL